MLTNPQLKTQVIHLTTLCKLLDSPDGAQINLNVFFATNR